jgi:hypothetical protein
MKFIKHRFDILTYWINEREDIRLKKERAAPTPWSGDPLMKKWRWCNVNRCHDRETRWIFKHIIEAYDLHPALWFNLCIARFINWSPTLSKMGFMEVWDPRRFCETIEAIQKSGEKAYTGAYMIRAGTGDDAKMPKHEYLVKRVFTPLWDAAKERPHYKYESRRCGDWDVFLSQIFGMGNFMRNQIITDMKYSHLLPKDNTIDWDTFCLAGPGTRRGMNRLCGFELGRSWNDEHMNATLQDLRRRVVEDVSCPAYFEDLNNLANCLCEFDKYMRLTNGEGEPRSTYRPSSEPLP